MKLTAESSSFTSAMQNAKRNAKEFGDASEKAADKAEKAFSNLKSTIIGLGIGQALKTSITDAMNAVESESLFEVSLGKYANQARAWSEEMSSALSLDGYALRKNLGTLYNMTTSMGLTKDKAYELSTGLTALAEDMASFYNLSSEEAFVKLRSGITGEAEPLKAIGILLNETAVEQAAYRHGIAETGTALTDQQKVLARYAAILDQTANAQGDLARTMDSPSNQLRATMNDLKQASIEFGMALMPIVQTALPVLREVISDIKPVAANAASGLSVIGTALQLLESPAARGIAYVALATAAIRKLNMSLGSTMTGLLLIGSVLTYIIGEYSTAEEKADDVVSTTFDGASIAADGAKESTDKFAKSLGEAGKAAARLAGFDEITKLSGGSSGNLGAQFYEAADAAENATSFIEDYEKALASVSEGNWNVSPELDLSKVDWGRLQADIKQISDDFTAIFTGDEQERYEALKRLDEKIRELFGDEWSDFWGDVGKDIFNAFNDFGSEESYRALYNLNERIKEIPFGETISETFKKAGEGLHNITLGIQKLAEGNIEEALSYFSSAVGLGSDAATFTSGSFLFGPVGGILTQNLFSEDVQNAADTATKYFEALAQGDATTATIIKDKGDKATQDALKTVNNFGMDLLTLGQGEMAPVTWDIVNWWSDTFQGLGSWIAESTKANTSEVTAPVTREDVYTMTQNAPGAGTPIQIHNTIELDGEPVKSWTRNWQSEDVAITNGR